MRLRRPRIDTLSTCKVFDEIAPGLLASFQREREERVQRATERHGLRFAANTERRR